MTELTPLLRKRNSFPTTDPGTQRGLITAANVD